MAIGFLSGAISLAKGRKTGNGENVHAGPHSERLPLAKSSRKHDVVKHRDSTKCPDSIRIRGASTHNLRTIDLDVPRGKLVLFTGVSGSGKSSLAFDTIFAEGQRRYIECLSPFARQFIQQLPSADVDSIDGIPPTVSVSQQGLDRSRSPRSIVATRTEIHDYLRLLFARVGDVRCHSCNAAIGSVHPNHIASSILALPEGTRVLILAPLVRRQKGDLREAIQKARREGFIRVRIDGSVVSVDPDPEIDPAMVHDVEMVIDRQVVRPGMEPRLIDSIAVALRHGDGAMILATQQADQWTDTTYNTRLSCLVCGVKYRDIEPRSFNWNSPYGACPHCQGLGIVQEFSHTKTVPNPKLSLAAGAVAPFRAKSSQASKALLRELEKWDEFQHCQHLPFEDLSDQQRRTLWSGVDQFRGVNRLLLDAYNAADDLRQTQLHQYIEETTCPECNGTRLNIEGRSVRIENQSLPEFLALSIDEALERFQNIKLPPDRAVIGEPLLAEITSRLTFLQKVGVGYVTLDRPVGTLSGGEAQRIRLASCIGSGLNGACYVLDEPTVGLHPTDTDKLVAVLEDLRDRDNSVLVVEHDEAVIRRADWIVELGPGAGRHGGNIVAQGTFDDLISTDCLTADYLSGRRSIHLSPQQTATTSRQEQQTIEPSLVLSGITHRNIKNLTLRIPRQQLVAITGVSGSGKSSLIMEMLVPLVRNALGGNASVPGTFDALHGHEQFQVVVEVDQSPIGTTPRSCPASYAGVLGRIRNVFAKSRDARVRGYTPRRFSFNAKEGQCPQCLGLGARKVELKFMPDLFAPCTSCHGRRFNRSTLSVRFRGKSIADVLAMSIEEAAEFFENHPRIARVLEILCQFNLGYLELGQWATTLSGGEAQRLKLATELARSDAQSTLYVLDEPTTGLHFHDIASLLKVLRNLVTQGHTVVLIEHNLDVIRAADWMIDLGPGGGPNGGKIVAQGPPQHVAANAQTPTALALAQTTRPQNP